MIYFRMKNYKEYIKKSITISNEINLINALHSISNDVEVIIESGTYLGLGSTKMLANIFSNKSNFEKLYTSKWVFL